MSLENLAYATVQVAHNFGAAAVMGSSVFALWPERREENIRRKLAWLALSGWGMQAASGGGLGAVSFYYYGEFPDIHGIAIAALAIKVGCAISGFLLAAAYLRGDWREQQRLAAWRAQIAFGAMALSAAAILRWFA